MIWEVNRIKYLWTIIQTNVLKQRLKTKTEGPRHCLFQYDYLFSLVGTVWVFVVCVCLPIANGSTELFMLGSMVLLLKHNLLQTSHPVSIVLSCSFKQWLFAIKYFVKMTTFIFQRPC